ncbi:hypothetical protein EPUS_07628 [Endocarpon pusillum Z07020]|uniref:Uncharacterized protein n=1 Tax=Endocarpon pusillum (strain Z07020 / HMAS-L-300199) TaxID=1263415 RepID=U1GWH1_ENDPU|nr:uncharacterized protein EPUS_07628 [Endocarpon pusillum Z07020]ERF76838.1 hypothetical protein EPUS_07628 [Endocarpon pusillum Z07020]
MPPKKLKQSSVEPRVSDELVPSIQQTSEAQRSSTELQDAADSLNDGPRSLQGEASASASADPQTPPRPIISDDAGSPFRTFRQELGLSTVEVPALRPRSDSSDPFVIRLRPSVVRDEASLQAAINEIIYNEDRVQTFMRLSLSPAEATAVRDRQGAQVLSQLNDESLTLRDALWYLEYAGWDVELAILHHMHDIIDRAEAPGPNSVQIQSEFPVENPYLDRAPVRGGDDFDQAKLKLHYMQYHVARTMTYPEWKNFDRNDVDHVRALNRWRWKTIMAQVGLKEEKIKGTRYNRLELLWLRNYLLAHPKCTSRELTDNWNANFAGAMLPGETKPRPKRSLAAITCLRLRQPGATKKSKKKRTADDAGLGAPDESADDTGMAQDANVVQEEQDSAMMLA